MVEQLAETVFNKRITADSYLMGLEAPSIAHQAQAGHFVMLQVRTGTDPLLRRPFSICAVQDDIILLLYRVIGKGTQLMTEIKPNQRISILGPLGKGFILPQKDQTPILVAGGIGIAPLLFLSLSLNNALYRLLAGFNTSSDIIQPHELGFHKIDISFATDDGTAGYAGLVTGLLEKTLAQSSEKDDIMIYSCGPSAMLKKVAAIAQENKIACQVSFESQMACGVGACQGCVIKAAAGQKQPYYQVCKDGPVFPAQWIDWTAV
jgi:dihydroorotate dehydrogenase electron transfer subunit